MASGGRRPGAGRPKKTLAQNLLDGNPGKRPLKVLKFNNQKQLLESLAPAEYLPELARDVYLATVAWLEGTGCLDQIFPGLIEEYALTKGRWLEAEIQVTRFGLVAKNTNNGQPVMSPFVNASIEYFKASDRAWQKIFTVLKANCSEEYKQTPQSDAMGKLLDLKG
jgi:hypothetical protein